MAHFVVLYDRSTQELVSFDRYDVRADALSARWEAEPRQRLNPSLEVVVLSAEDEDAVRRTHARYFKTATELLNG